MKFRLWEIIVLISLIALAVVFANLHSQWAGFVYFTMSTILVFVGFFVNNRIFYLRYLKREYDNSLSAYFAELYNNNLITKEQYQTKDQRIINGYYKGFQRSKLINILIMAGLIFISFSYALVVFGIW